MHFFAFLALCALGIVQFFVFRCAAPSTGVFRLAVGAVIAAQFVVSAWRPFRGLLLLLFLLPLFNNSSFLLRLDSFPPALALFLSFFAGWLFRRIDQGDLSRVKTPLNGPLLLYVLAGLGSGAITLLRYADFYPFVGDRFPDFSVNPLDETSRQAVIWVFRMLLVFLSGPGIFWAALHVVNRRGQVPRALAALACGLTFSVLFGIYQSRGFGLHPTREHVGLGNWPFFARVGRINATFVDPNALGSFLLLSLPAVSALFFVARNRAAKAGVLLLLLSALYVLENSGSRTGMLGLVLAGLIAGGLALAHLSDSGIGRYSRFWRPILVALIVVVAFAPSRLGSIEESDSTLARRLGATLEKIRERGWVGMLGEERWPMWERAVRVTAKFPVAGIGLGAFQTEVPNFVAYDFRRPFFRDNANSFYLQTTTEMGFAGLVLALAVLAGVVRGALRAVNRPFRVEGNLAQTSLLAGALISMTVMFLTGPHTFFPEVQVLFWALVGLVFAGLYSVPPRVPAERREARVRPLWKRRMLPVAGGALVVALLVGQTISTATTLSLSKEINSHEWTSTWGFYPWEKGLSGERLRWTRKEAGTVVVTRRPLLSTRLFILHADAAQNPVTVSVFLNGRQARAAVYDQPASEKRVTLLLPRTDDGRIDIRFRVSRVFVPSRHGTDSLDSRELGVLVSDFQFLDVTQPEGFGFSDWREDAESGSPRYRTIDSQAAMRIDLSAGKDYEFLAGAGPSDEGSPPPVLKVYADNKPIQETRLPENGWTRVRVRIQPDPGQISALLRFEVQSSAALPPGFPFRPVRITQVRPLSAKR